ncbi:MAG: hypothetical protein A2359_01075 [Candidatus Moranbacteria bacterium RIFOXYB1_FULL_43_19]|nr:MAG: hypothetical protein A2359_01075 [Candidatus Moranbacteria bacterium RIFOXYB1_FULL_43_19]OGI33007.1 MAG: hypothetical protein A2420_01500 [Candidatus Moranbacteria bacterium RIFOXYC1_FULL_44_13]OGI38222.1 MAG: hypothetical protein A2612_04485 [Candidatus Moranbacteria bacterium RIFOXYD1_FULL_44_12]
MKKKKGIRQIVILAGGYATRLHPITIKIPKSMVEINGRPFFEYQVELCKKNGIEEIILCVGHLWEQIRDHFGDGNQFGIKIVYSVENEKLDTGGAIKNALPHLDEKFFVMYGDSFLDIDWKKIAEFYARSKAEGLMTVYKNNWKLEPSRVLLDDMGYAKEYNKENPRREMKYMEYGLNILPKKIIGKVREKSFPISRYFDILMDKRQLISCESKKRFYEIGCREGKETFKKYISKK